MQNIDFFPRWREELVARYKEGVLIFELTMGNYQVCFPSETMWMHLAPEWAKDKRELFFSECSKWCSGNNIPITVVENGFFYEEKDSLA